jgi:tetratricopeptide (TPR) repeat protein
MANVYFRQGKLAEALENYRMSVAISLQAAGGGGSGGESGAHTAHRYCDAGVSYDGMANVYQEQGKYTEALEYHEKVLSIRLPALGASHPSVGNTYYSMARAHKGQGNITQALTMYEKSHAIFLASYGAPCPLTRAASEGVRYCRNARVPSVMSEVATKGQGVGLGVVTGPAQATRPAPALALTPTPTPTPTPTSTSTPAAAPLSLPAREKVAVMEQRVERRAEPRRVQIQSSVQRR